MQRIQAVLPYQSMLAVPNIRCCQVLAMLWKNEIELHVQNHDQNHIDALMLSNQPHHGDSQASMAALKNIFVGRRRVYYDNYTLFGYVLVTSTRFQLPRRNKDAYKTYWTHAGLSEEIIKSLWQTTLFIHHSSKKNSHLFKIIEF